VPWVYILLAGLFEIGFTTSLKLSHNFTEFWPSVSFVVCAALSFGLLSRGIRTIPLGTGYAVWTSIGAIGTALVGMLMFSEPPTLGRIVFLGLIVVAIVGLKLVDDSPTAKSSTPATSSTMASPTRQL
jgi:quaternary ammonium compound-resistance protein SugE